jgi:hypothetical protein
VAGAVSSAARVRVSSAVNSAIADESDAAFAIVAAPPTPTISVTSPNGAESWTVGTLHAITWTSANLTANIKIELNRAYPSGTWETLAASVTNGGTWSWTVAGAVSSAARVRVSSAVNSAIADESDAAFAIVAAPPTPTICVTSPDGSESWTVGTIHPITWTSSNLTENVNIELNRAYPGGAWEILATTVTNNGSWNWTVAGTVSATARVRITAATRSALGDTSNAAFTIAAPPTAAQITVTSPNGGESWQLSSRCQIIWSSQGVSGRVRIEVNRSYPGGMWEVLSANAANTGTFLWNVRGATTTMARIRVSSVSQSTVYDVSDGAFCIRSVSRTTGSPSPERAAGTYTDLSATNYPNPFNPTTTISFAIPEAGNVTLAVFDIMGRKVADLVNSYQEAGSYSVPWDGTAVPAGVYVCRITMNGMTSANRMLLMK